MMGDHGSIGDMAGWMGAIGFIWILVALALLVLIVVATIWLALRLRHEPPRLGGRGTATLDELDRRYARGELDRDTYLQMRRDLTDR